MKKVVNILTIAGFMFFGAIQSTFAQDAGAEKTFHQELKQRFIEGDPGFMGVVLVALIVKLYLFVNPRIILNNTAISLGRLIIGVPDKNTILVLRYSFINAFK